MPSASGSCRVLRKVGRNANRSVRAINITDHTGVFVTYRSNSEMTERPKYNRSICAITLLCLYRAKAATIKQMIALNHRTRVAILSVCVLCAKNAVPVIIHRINRENACGLFRHCMMPRIYRAFAIIVTTIDVRAMICVVFIEKPIINIGTIWDMCGFARAIEQ